MDNLSHSFKNFHTHNQIRQESGHVSTSFSFVFYWTINICGWPQAKGVKQIHTINRHCTLDNDIFLCGSNWCFWSSKKIESGRIKDLRSKKDRSLQYDVLAVFLWDMGCVTQTRGRSGEILPMMFKMDSWYPLGISYARLCGHWNGNIFSNKVRIHCHRFHWEGHVIHLDGNTITETNSLWRVDPCIKYFKGYLKVSLQDGIWETITCYRYQSRRTFHEGTKIFQEHVMCWVCNSKTGNHWSSNP